MFRVREFLFVLLLLTLSSTAYAGGALKTNINGQSFRWEGTVVYNPESGALKSGVYDAEASRQLIADAFATWSSLSGVSINITQGDILPDGGNTTVNNFAQYYNAGVAYCYDNDPGTPCYSPIIFDEDGSILEKLFGECAQFSILGFAGFVDIAGDSSDPALAVLKKGQAIFSGACIAPAISKSGCPPCTQVMDDKEVRSLVLHELGHFLGMDHSQVNPDSYLECNSQFNCPANLSEHIPTMFPLLLNGANQVSLHKDDETQFRRLYGSPEQTGCTVEGSVLASDGQTPLRGVEVVARNSDPDLSGTDALAYVSGAEAPRVTVKGKTTDNCLTDCGKYSIAGLSSGETYQLCVQRILSKFEGTKSINPVSPPYQGVDNACPEGLTVTCDCSGDSCEKITGVDIVTSNTGVDQSSNLVNGPSGGAGGCSLSKDKKIASNKVYKSNSLYIYSLIILWITLLIRKKSLKKIDKS